MRINEIQIQNFKGLKELTETFDSNFTVFVGENGSGKTSVLEAVACLLNRWTQPMGHNGDAPKNMTRLESSHRGQTLMFKEIYPLRICTRMKIAEDDIKFTLFDNGSSKSGPKCESDLLAEFALGSKRKFENLFDDEIEHWPLIAFYDVGRGAGSKPKLDWNRLFADKPKRTDGYKKWRDSSDLVAGFISWLGRQEAITFQEKEETLISRTVKNAVCSCLPNANDLHFSAKEGEPIVEWNDDTAITFSNLSQGQKSILAMVGDIARRCAMVNPHLETNAPAKTPGIVLIDELDLHLHPRWQRRIVDDLKRTFPKIQFIATTHSPFIIQALQPGELRVLGGDEPKIEYANRGIEEIARFIQGVDMPETSERFTSQKDAAKTYFQMLRDGRDENDPELREAKSKLDRLTVSYADNPGLEAIIEIQEEAAIPTTFVREE